MMVRFKWKIYRGLCRSSMIGRKEIRAEVIQTKPTSTGTDLGNPNWEQEGQGGHNQSDCRNQGNTKIMIFEIGLEQAGPPLAIAISPKNTKK